MSDYQRFITYINLYKQDDKLKNVGFAKIEKRKEQCRFEIHMKNIGYTGQNSQIYFYVRRDQELECIPVGSLQIVNGTADRRLLLNGDNIGGSGRRLEEIHGLVIFINEQVMLASQWKDGELMRSLFRLPGQEPKASLNVEGATPGGLEESMTGPQQEPQASPPQSMTAPRQEPQASPPQSMTGPQQEPQASPPQDTSAPRQGTPDSLHVAEAAAVNTNPALRPWSATWQMMLESYPVLTPFEGEEDIRCVRIELKELRLLPRRYWYLGNNSFLLHGFFNYRYLILGQLQEQGIKRWFLGVPGIFQNQEKVMATIFGFPEFKAEKAVRQKTNQFGYWYRFMDEQD